MITGPGRRGAVDAREGDRGNGEDLIRENGKGNVVLARSDRRCVPIVLAAKGTRLGMPVSAAHRCAAAAAEPADAASAAMKTQQTIKEKVFR